MPTPDEIDHTLLTFGKYKGMSPAQIAGIDTSYITWLHDKVLDKGIIVSEVLYRECVKNPIKPQRDKSWKPNALYQRPPAKSGSIAESRSHFDSPDDDDDVPF